MKNIRIFVSEEFHFLVLKFSVYLNRHFFIMRRKKIRMPTAIILFSVNTSYL